jgi:hypothetical protein
MALLLLLAADWPADFAFPAGLVLTPRKDVPGCELGNQGTTWYLHGRWAKPAGFDLANVAAFAQEKAKYQTADIVDGALNLSRGSKLLGRYSYSERALPAQVHVRPDASAVEVFYKVDSTGGGMTPNARTDLCAEGAALVRAGVAK